ncbi:MAG: ABC transporter substrate-binding protein [Candidatus Rokuibacteriota bacterium]|nr:MAG: ABC transporter substrate-binding protein [Candidatus Rokubacteria bacterium]
MTSRRAFIGVALLGAVAAPRAVGGQGRKVARIGVLSPFVPSDGPAPSFQVFRARLRELGYVEGDNLAFEYRWAEGKYDRLPALAAELAQSKVDLIVSAWSTPAALAAKRATTTIPIVFVGVGDAVGVELVEGLARPGGNVTGSTFLSEETVGKLLQLLKEVVPRATRVAIVFNPANPVYGSMLKDVDAIGRQLNVQVVRLGIQGTGDVESVFDSARRERLDGLVVMRDFVLITYRERIVELAARQRLPVMYGMREFVDAGGLMSFEPSLAELYRRAADLVHKILRGAKPADLPVEQSSRFELIVNLRTAKTLGLAVPRPVLLRADHVLE